MRRLQELQRQQRQQQRRRQQDGAELGGIHPTRHVTAFLAGLQAPVKVFAEDTCVICLERLGPEQGDIDQLIGGNGGGDRGGGGGGGGGGRGEVGISGSSAEGQGAAAAAAEQGVDVAVKALRCGHQFHAHCLCEWLGAAGNTIEMRCPTCRAPVRWQRALVQGAMFAGAS